MKGAPLDGIVVADFTRVLAGPLATSHLADLGADVIKVERMGEGDDTRAWGPPWAAGTSTYFAAANRGKRSIQVDLHQPSGIALAVELVRRADVVVENFRTGVMDRLGLGPDRVAELNPRAVYCSITGFGSAAGAHLPGYDFVVQALGGLMSVTGTDSSGPLKVGVAVVDVITGKDAVIGILAALADRERTGLGQRVEVNLLSSLLGALVNQASAALATGVSPPRLGNQHPSIAPYETLRCADGELAIAVGNDAQFARLAAVLGRPELADDPRLRTNADRVAHRDVMRVGLEVALATRTAHEWQQALTDAGVPVGVVSDVLGAFELAASLGLEPAIDVGDGHAPQIRNPVSYGRSLLRPPSPPPALGQHDDEVRAWLAGPPDQKGT